MELIFAAMTWVSDRFGGGLLGFYAVCVVGWFVTAGLVSIAITLLALLGIV